MTPRRPAEVLWLAFVLALPVSARALTLEKGIELGANLANFRGESADLVGTENKAGFVGGPFVAARLSPVLAVEGEARFSMKGAKSSGEWLDERGTPLGSFNVFWDLSYVEVPVLLRASFPPSAPVQPMIYAGPEMDILVRGIQKMTETPFGDSSWKLTHLKPVDFAVAVGGGLRIGNASRRLVADFRYTPSIPSIFRDSGSHSGEFVNNVLSFTLGYGF